MKQCLDERLEARLKQIEKEHELEVQALERISVAQRAQIFGQFYQSVRESREAILDSLNEEWYEIQNRRRSAHSVQDFGLLYPTTAAQRLRNAIAYNNEVSYLSGIAKYRGFPAGPPLRGASGQEVEDDFEAMKVSSRRMCPSLVAALLMHYQRGRRQRQHSIMQPLEEHALLGPAGEQFIRNTPWANPNHASHKAHQQPLAQPDVRSSNSSATSKPAGGVSNGRVASPSLNRVVSGGSEASKAAGQLRRISNLSSSAGRASKGSALPSTKPDSAIASGG
jgi:hypothetical protein